MKTLAIVILAILFFGCGKPTETSTIKIDTLKLNRADSNLLIARQNFEKDSSEENFIWLGRRLAYVNQYDEAIDVYSRGLEQFPTSYKLYRHRGHRYISQRKFDVAIADLTKASELMRGKPIDIEPDGIPNQLNRPLSSTQFNVWYHLGLAYYLKGDYKNAVKAYQSCLEVSVNDDLLVATTDWFYMTLRRMGNKPTAESLLNRISDSMTIVENDSYYKRLKMYQGKLTADSLLNSNPQNENYELNLATQGYGLGNWYLYNGDSSRAEQTFRKVLSGASKSAFGYIAAENDMIKFFN